MGSIKPVEFTLLFVMVACLPVILNVASSGPSNLLYRGSSLSVERPSIDVLVSENGSFNAGFYKVRDDAFSFAIWYANTPNQEATVVWMANRDWPVNSRHSRLSFGERGDIALLDADGSVVWTTSVDGAGSSAVVIATTGVVLELQETGNLLLLDGERKVVWQSFDHPTDTLLPGQPLTMSIRLVSRAAERNYSSGYYDAQFSDDNMLSFFYNSPNVSSIYWPDPDKTVEAVGPS